MSLNELSRRELLRGAATAALLAGLPAPLSALAGAGPDDEADRRRLRDWVGALRVTVNE